MSLCLVGLSGFVAKVAWLVVSILLYCVEYPLGFVAVFDNFLLPQTEKEMKQIINKWIISNLSNKTNFTHCNAAIRSPNYTTTLFRPIFFFTPLKGRPRQFLSLSISRLCHVSILSFACRSLAFSLLFSPSPPSRPFPFPPSLSANIQYSSTKSYHCPFPGRIIWKDSQIVT